MSSPYTFSYHHRHEPNNRPDNRSHGFVTSTPITVTSFNPTQRLQCARTPHSKPLTSIAKWKPTMSSESTSPPSSFSYSVGTSNSEDLQQALQEASRQACTQFRMNNKAVSVAFILTPSTFENTARDSMNRVISTCKRALAMLNALTPTTLFFGCTTGCESKQVMITLLHIPESAGPSSVKAYSSFQDYNLDWSQKQWYESLNGVEPKKGLVMLILHNEFEEISDLLKCLNFAYPGIRKIGAHVGKVNPLHEPCMFYDSNVLREGCVVLCMDVGEDVQIDVSVAQGVRGVGRMMEVLAVSDEGYEISKVKELGSGTETVSAPMILLDMWKSMDIISLEESRQISKYLLLGSEVVETPRFSRDATSQHNKEIVMLSRKVIGFNELTKSIGIERMKNEGVRVGSKIQFQIGDAESARNELSTIFNRLKLEGSAKVMNGFSLRGCFCLTDMERGELLHGDIAKHLDTDMFRERFQGMPLSVITSGGQIGPIPEGDLQGDGVGESHMLCASAVYICFYGRDQ